jgi:hypothetical protein
MARPGASEEARIKRLRGALARAAAQGLMAEVLTFKPMCDLLQVNRTTLREWCNEPEVAESGALIFGGNGIEYQFNPIALIWVLIRFWERKLDRRVNENLRIREMIAGDALDSAPAEMTLRDVREAMQLHLQLLESEKESGLLVRSSESEAEFNRLILALREATLSAPQKQDPTNEWSPEFREKFDNALADFMVLLRHAGQDALSAPDEPVPAGADGKSERAPMRKAVRPPRRSGAKSPGTATTA